MVAGTDAIGGAVDRAAGGRDAGGATVLRGMSGVGEGASGGTVGSAARVLGVVGVSVLPGVADSEGVAIQLAMDGTAVTSTDWNGTVAVNDDFGIVSDTDGDWGKHPNRNQVSVNPSVGNR